jgi:Phospholipase_D-nuclease N-terminal
MTRKKLWSEVSGPQRAGLIVVSAIQIALAVSAWADLARRDASTVKGSKSIWAAVIAVNFIGPIAYFIWGRHPK